MRLGGAYELFHVARDTEELRQTVLDILCAHIRRTTGEDKYREEHKSKSSEEIQSLLTLLFVQDHDIFKGLHINFQESWLTGADLQQASLEGANLDKTHLEGADLWEAGCKERIFTEHACKESHLSGACLQGCGDWPHGTPFGERIRMRIGKESDLSGVVFGGGISQADVDSHVAGLSDEKAEVLRERREPHIDVPANHEPPEDSGAKFGAYTKEESRTMDRRVRTGHVEGSEVGQLLIPTLKWLGKFHIEKQGGGPSSAPPPPVDEKTVYRLAPGGT